MLECSLCVCMHPAVSMRTRMHVFGHACMLQCIFCATWRKDVHGRRTRALPMCACVNTCAHRKQVKGSRKLKHGRIDRCAKLLLAMRTRPLLLLLWLCPFTQITPTPGFDGAHTSIRQASPPSLILLLSHADLSAAIGDRLHSRQNRPPRSTRNDGRAGSDRHKPRTPPLESPLT